MVLVGFFLSQRRINPASSFINTFDLEPAGDASATTDAPLEGFLTLTAGDDGSVTIERTGLRLVEGETANLVATIIDDKVTIEEKKGKVSALGGKETYYNMNMNGVIKIMRSMGNNDQYWVSADGAKRLGNYVIVAANLNTHPRGSIVDTSLGKGIVCDTGGFAKKNAEQIDIATSW